MRVLVTGSSGLIGSAAVEVLHDRGCDIIGVDNNMRADFFGARGDTRWNRIRLENSCARFSHREIDIRDRPAIDRLFRDNHFDLIVHAAAQPSHDLAASRPFDDFETNANGTLNLLEATRTHRPEAIFAYLSTNKVYGDGPNHVPIRELETRYDFADPAHARGIDETFPIDRCLHSLFGVSKAAADLMVQEYGRYFGLRTGVFRGGCLTGPQHSGVELHGFLNYLVATALAERRYTVYGYKGKQVRDQIHSHDVVEAIWHFAQAPRPGEVYNIGGGRANAASLIECVEKIADATGRRPTLTMTDDARIGDHICYYTDLTKLSAHYPEWRQHYSLDQIIEEMVGAMSEQRRLASA
jgi:CDP-paratose 2-epimerase